MKTEYTPFTPFTPLQEDTLSLILKTCAKEAVSLQQTAKRYNMELFFSRALKCVFLRKKRQGLFADISTDIANKIFDGGLMDQYIIYRMIDRAV